MTVLEFQCNSSFLTAQANPSRARVRGNQINGHELAVGNRMQFWRTLISLSTPWVDDVHDRSSPERAQQDPVKRHVFVFVGLFGTESECPIETRPSA